MIHPVGVIHGRFQVLHHDHLKYLLAGKELCEHLIVGITNPAPEMTSLESMDLARSCIENNPLTYDERNQMVRTALLEAKVPAKDFSIVPMPICRPELLKNYVPTDAVYYLTIYDNWGREKKKRLEQLGLKTIVMWEKQITEKGLTGTAVRHAIQKGDGWEEMVPASISELIAQWDLQERLKNPS
jgi:nicotinamide-nucleotide adenylyltransferase